MQSIIGSFSAPDMLCALSGRVECTRSRSVTRPGTMLPEPETGVTSRVWGDNRRVWDTVNRPQTLPRRNGDLCEAPCGAPLDLVMLLSGFTSRESPSTIP